MKFPRPDEPTPAIRAWKVEQAQIQVGFAEGLFRIVEMTLVVGVVHYLEMKLKAAIIISPLLVALIAIYLRSRMTIALIPALDRYEINENQRHRLYWLFWAMTVVAFFGMNYLVNYLVPILAANQE